MNGDDTPVGRLLTRREALALLGISGVRLATGATFGGPSRPGRTGSLPPCVVRPEQTEGPYFVDELLERADIRTDPATGAISPGTPLALTFLLSRLGRGSCDPLPGAQVDLWQCDALGVYSDVSDPTFNTRGHKFLRGHQRTDGTGRAVFRTIYPGWYPGRAVHIHFKIRTPAGSPRAAEFTSQLYFDDRLTDKVHASPPYSTKRGSRTRNLSDRIFQRGGDQLVLRPSQVAEGYEATFALSIDLAQDAGKGDS
jgi:protocatechuate 3,4-dioxygenase beta subunit